VIVGGLLTPLENLLSGLLEWFHSSVGLKIGRASCRERVYVLV